MKQKIKNLIDKNFFVMVLAVFPLLAALHELGHIMVGKVFGFRTYFFFTTSLAFYTKKSPCYPNCQFEDFLVHWGGPAFSWLIILASFLSFLRWRKKVFLLGLSLIGPFYNNFLVDVLTILLLRDEYAVALSDENKIAEYLNIPELLVSGIFAFIGTLILLICLRKIDQKDRLRLVVSSILGMLLAYILLWIVLEPLLQPDTMTLWKMLNAE